MCITFSALGLSFEATVKEYVPAVANTRDTEGEAAYIEFFTLEVAGHNMEKLLESEYLREEIEAAAIEAYEHRCHE